MTLNELKKLFKKRYSVLPCNNRKYQEMKKEYKIKQAASNQCLGLLKAEDKLRNTFDIYCEAWGIK